MQGRNTYRGSVRSLATARVASIADTSAWLAAEAAAFLKLVMPPSSLSAALKSLPLREFRSGPSWHAHPRTQYGSGRYYCPRGRHQTSTAVVSHKVGQARRTLTGQARNPRSHASSWRARHGLGLASNANSRRM
eukprot:COSAG01_NODE_2338_length_7873_cov_25.961538_3_plen_134_part_00